MPFEWDQHNLRKIEAHGLTAEEVEAVIVDLASTTLEQDREMQVETRWETVGRCAGKRIVAVWTVRGGDVIRVVTAWIESRERKRR